MITQQLIDYIKAQLELGANRETITQRLSGKGWIIEDVNEGFDTVSAMTDQTSGITDQATAALAQEPIISIQPTSPAAMMRNSGVSVPPTVSPAVAESAPATAAAVAATTVTITPTHVGKKKSETLAAIIIIIVVVLIGGGLTAAYLTGTLQDIPFLGSVLTK